MLIHLWTGDGGDYGWDVEELKLVQVVSFLVEILVCASTVSGTVQQTIQFSQRQKLMCPTWPKFGGLSGESWGLEMRKSK